MILALLALLQVADTDIGAGAQRIPTLTENNLLKGSDWCLLERSKPDPAGNYFAFYGEAKKGSGVLLSNSSWTSLRRDGTTDLSLVIDGRPIVVTASTSYEELRSGKKIGTIFLNVGPEMKKIFLTGGWTKMKIKKGNVDLSTVEFTTLSRLAYLEFAACMEGATDPFASEK